MNPSYILFLCGGRWQVPWIRFLKQKGHKIILVDPNSENWCKQYADVFFIQDVKNTDAIYRFVSDNKFKIELVTSDQTDVATKPVAVLSEKFGTKHIPLPVVEKFTDKFLSKEHAITISKEHVPAFARIHSSTELLNFSKVVESEFIIKPADSQSSRGISVLNGHSDTAVLENAFQNAQQFGTTGYSIAEEFVKGTEITIEGFVQKGKHNILAASRKKHFRVGIASELEYQLELNDELRKDLFSFHNKLVESTGIELGITHTEYIIDEKTNKFWLIEMACRGGGSLIPSAIVPWVSGFDLYESWYNHLFKNPEVNETPVYGTSQRAAILYFFEFPAGKVADIRGLEQCKQIEGVHIIDLEFKPGDIIHPATDDRGRQGFVIILAESKKQITNILGVIKSLLKVEIAENGI